MRVQIHQVISEFARNETVLHVLIKHLFVGTRDDICGMSDPFPRRDFTSMFGCTLEPLCHFFTQFIDLAHDNILRPDAFLCSAWVHAKYVVLVHEVR